MFATGAFYAHFCMKIFMLGIPPCCDLGIYAMRRPGDNSMPRPADTPHATALGIITGDYDHMLRYRVFFTNDIRKLFEEKK